MAGKAIEQGTLPQNKTMKVQKEFSPDIAEVLEAVPTEKLAEFLGIKPVGNSPSSQSSKWAKLVEEIRNDPDLKDPEFKRAWKTVKEGAEEMRHNFAFKHDL